jgi:alpha-galactosidase
METVGCQSNAFTALADHLLRRDGELVAASDRRFWDLNDPRAVEILTERVIDLLERCGFGYLKVDYNETLGLGCDNPDGIGEGLRQQVLASYRFFERIRERLPNLVIENCASGGHRLEPSMLARTAMSSFSDAHELVEIPIIAAGLHRLLLPRQSQIWAVLHRADSDRRLVYSLAATFLGRMCLSGEITELNEAQWACVLEAQRLYRLAAPILRRGTSRIHGDPGESRRYPHGWQAVVRTSADEGSALVVLHAFEDAPPTVAVPTEATDWKIGRVFPESHVSVSGGELRWTPPGDFSACVVLLERE